jgi:hypothetical protein
VTLLHDFIAAQLALLPIVDRVAPQQLGYGTDLSCVTDITPQADEVSQESPRAIGEALARRFISPRTSVLDDNAYGLDLRARLNAGQTRAQLTALRSQIRVECLKDDRVSDADVTVTFVLSPLRMSVAIAVTPHASDDEFSLTFFVTADGVQLVGSINEHG